MGLMSDRRTLTGILALTVGGCLAATCLAAGLIPVLAGPEDCTAAFQPFGEGSLHVWTDFSVLPYGGSCVFQDADTGHIHRNGPNLLWSVGIAGGALVGLVGAGLIVTQAGRRRTLPHRSTVLG